MRTFLKTIVRLSVAGFVLLSMTPFICGQDVSENQSQEDVKKTIRQIEEIGVLNILIRSIPPAEESDEGDGEFAARRFGLKRNDLNRIRTTIPTIASAIATREISTPVSATASPDADAIESLTIGCTPNYLEGHQLELARGHFLTQHEVASSENVCVLSSELATELFGAKDPINQMLFLPDKRIYLKVVGVLKLREPRLELKGLMPARDFANDIYLPITTMRRRFGDMEISEPDGGVSIELSQIVLQVNSEEAVERTVEMVEALLRSDDAGRDDFVIVVPQRILKKAKAKLDANGGNDD